MTNPYFQVLPKEIQQELGKAAFDAFIRFPPSFVWNGTWEEADINYQTRWLAVVEAVLNRVQDKQEFVTTELMAYNERQRVLADATERFENWRPDEAYHNNYQQLAQLISLHAEVVNAQLLVNRKDIEQGHFKTEGDGDTAKVFIPNVNRPE